MQPIRLTRDKNFAKRGRPLFLRVTLFLLTAMIGVLDFAPGVSAQSSEPIVLVCTDPPSVFIYRLNLARRTVALETIIKQLNLDTTENTTITKINGQKIVFTFGTGTNAVEHTIDRYTSQVHWRILDPQRAANAQAAQARTSAPCQRQTRQF
jgi:hypothetical protein